MDFLNDVAQGRRPVVSQAPAPNPERVAELTEAFLSFLEVADPYTNALKYRSHLEGQETFLAYFQGNFWRFAGSCYEPFPEDYLKASIYSWAASKNDPDGDRVKPTRHTVEGIIDALKGVVHVGQIPSVPAWIGGASGAAPGDVLSCRNGLLHLPTLTLHPSDKRFFALNALNFDFDPNAKSPNHWLYFLNNLWGRDMESIETLQEIFGLSLTADTSFQKIFLLVGPRRSGKGTIARVLTELVGQANVSAPTLNGLGQHFGLESLIGKSLAIVSDARLGGRADVAAVTENLLRISGEDSVSVPRKHQRDWTAQLRVRFVLLSNELPAVLDQSGALAGRFIVLTLTNSFFGQEDRGLTQKLRAELPGILLWSLKGWDRLRKRGHFRQPTSSQAAVAQLEALASPITAFLRDRCVVVSGASIECGQLFRAWKAWTGEQGRDHAGTVQIFGRNLSAIHPEIRIVRPRVDAGRVRHYQGVRLRTANDFEEQ